MAKKENKVVISKIDDFKYNMDVTYDGVTSKYIIKNFDNFEMLSALETSTVDGVKLILRDTTDEKGKPVDWGKIKFSLVNIISVKLIDFFFVGE